MSSKTVSWGDNSQDNITLTAEEWSGNQTVTVNTAENFYKQRSKSIVFYSKTNSNVAATLNCTQAPATYSWDSQSINIDPESQSPVTVNLLTNVSTVENLHVELVDSAGGSISWATVSGLSPNGSGKWSVKITPIKNQGTSSRSATLKAILNKGNIDEVVAESSIVQGGDYIVSTEKSDIVGVGQKGRWYGIGTLIANEGNVLQVGVPAKGLTNAKFKLSSSTFVIEVTNTYASGRKTTSISQYTGGPIYLTMQIVAVTEDGTTITRAQSNFNQASVNYLYSQGAQLVVNSLTYNEFAGGAGSLYIGASSKSISEAMNVLQTNKAADYNALQSQFMVHPNVLTEYDGSASITFMGYSFNDSLTRLDTTIHDGLDCIGNYYYKCSCSGTATYSSGYSRTEGRSVVPSVSNKCSRGLPDSLWYPSDCIGGVTVKETDGTVAGKASETIIRVEVVALNNTASVQSVYVRVGVGAAYGESGALYQYQVYKQRYPVTAAYVFNKSGSLILRTPTISTSASRAYSFTCEDPQSEQMADYTVTADPSWPYTQSNGIQFDLSVQANRENVIELLKGVLTAAQTTSTITAKSPQAPQLDGTVWEIDDALRGGIWKFLITNMAASLPIPYKQ